MRHTTKNLFYSVGLVVGLAAADGQAQQSISTLPDGLTPEERTRLEKEQDSKDRAEMLLKACAQRLRSAQNGLMSQNYDLAHSEIRGFWNLASYTSQLIDGVCKKDSDRKKMMKMFEVGLRQNLTMLEQMRFEMPERYLAEANLVYEQTVKLRRSALQEVFGKDFFRE
jgi:hypothetical protein